MAILVHLRRGGHAKVQVWKERHALGVSVRLDTPEAVAVIFAHFPPKMNPEDRARVCNEAVGLLDCSRAIFNFL